MIRSKQHRGCRIQDPGTRGKHQTKGKKNPGVPAGAVGCRIQDPGTRGYWWCKTAVFSHSAHTAHGAPPLSEALVKEASCISSGSFCRGNRRTGVDLDGWGIANIQVITTC